MRIKSYLKTVISLLIITTLFAGCTNIDNTENNLNQTDENISNSNIVNDLKKIETKEELEEILKKKQGTSRGNYYSYATNDAADMVASEGFSVDTKAAGASDYSTTNIQVKDVDEADFVKNDGKYIYMLNQNNLNIIDAFPAQDSKIIVEKKIRGRPEELYVKDNKLFIISRDEIKKLSVSEYNFMPMNSYETITIVQIYNIENIENPVLEEEYEITGNYYESRLIENQIYLISKENIYSYYYDDISFPEIRNMNKDIINSEIYYIENHQDSYSMNTITSIDTEENKIIDSKSFMLGYYNTLYVSEDNIYIAFEKGYASLYSTQGLEMFEDVIYPQLPEHKKTQISQILDNKDMDETKKKKEIAKILEDMYANIEEIEKENLIDDIEERAEEYYSKLREERAKTKIYKFSLDEGNIEYESKGEIKGHLLNQFSMDEKNNNLRVATTYNMYFKGEQILHNNIYILDEDLNQLSEIEGIAENERIYSTRFIGDKLYMVTFKRIDPFFVIDLADPQNPQVLGELKLPGYSNYLHPYDENHIIGIGKETEEVNNRVKTKGVKLALFNVEDVNNPKLIDDIEIGEEGTESEILRDHKAFLFSKDKNLISIPIREIKDKVEIEEMYYNRYNVWNGVYLLNINDQGFDIKGKIKHSENQDSYYYYYSSPETVKRSLYMDNIIYTISQKEIIATDLETIEKINEIEITYDDSRYDYPHYYE